MREKIGEVLKPAKDLSEAAEILRGQEDTFFSENFLVERPILQALRSEESSVLLIDEIDRADEEFEAFLLEFLSDFQVSIPEIGTVKAKAPPVVILTSNRTRELSEALKRRCLHLQLGYPSGDVELEIVRLKAPGIGEALSEELVNTIQGIRELDLRKAPSIGETLDWAQSLVVLNAASGRTPRPSKRSRSTPARSSGSHPSPAGAGTSAPAICPSTNRSATASR